MTEMAPEKEPWQPPVYVTVRIRAGYEDSQCRRCGAFVGDIIAHNRHHRALDQIRDGTVALTQIVVPGLPEGSVIELLGTANEISWTEAAKLASESGTEFPKQFLGGGTIRFPPVAEGGKATEYGGGSGGAGASYIGNRLYIGRGGGGSDPSIPQCPICGAYGGGGHGGGCDNAGKPVSEWVGYEQ